MRRFSIILALLLATTLIFAQGSKEKDEKDYKLVLKLSHVFNPAEQLSKSMEEVADIIYKKTNGAIEIQTFNLAQLPVYKDAIEQVVRGANFISVEDPSWLGDYVPDYKALVGPMLYKSYDEYTAVVNSDLVKDMNERAKEKGIKVLALNYIFGFRNVITKDKVVRTPEDLKGLKIRVPASNLFVQTLNAMGATSVGLPWGETLSAVTQGVVDGLEGSEFTNLGTKVYESPAKNVANTGHFIGTCGVYINENVWHSIPEKYRDVIQEEFTSGATRMTELLKSQHAGVVKELESHGVKFNDVDNEAFTKATKVVFDDMEGLSDGVYEKLLAEIAKVRK